MYTMYASLPAVELAIEAAEAEGGAVERDRRRFVPFFEGAEEYAAQKGMIVGGRAATLFLLGAPLGPSDHLYEFYSSNALADARALADLVHARAPEGLGHYAVMTTRVPQQEFEVAADERPLFRVRALAVHRGARAADVVVPSRRPARYARDAAGRPLELLCMGPEIQLMDVYAALADPSRAADWPALLEEEEGLRALFFGEVGDKVAAAVGGGAAGRPAPPAAALAEALLAEYVPRTGHALVGSRALAAAAGAQRGRGRLQVVTENDFADEEKDVARVARRLGLRVEATVNDPRLPTDERLRRMTVYLVGERREPVLDVYNAAAHRLVAFSPGAGGRPPLGSPFVLLRFLLVDAWTIQLLLRMGAVAAPFARQVLGETVRDFGAAARAYRAAREAGDFEAVFPAHFVGRFVDPAIAAKRERHRAGSGPGRRFYPPYYPAKRAEKNA